MGGRVGGRMEGRVEGGGEMEGGGGMEGGMKTWSPVGESLGSEVNPDHRVRDHCYCFLQLLQENIFSS